MTSTDTEFLRRVSRIPPQGLGLSVDVYSPDLFELMEELDRRRLDYGYMEIFKASQRALAEVARRRPHVSFQYHAEGIWVTQPGLARSAQFETALASAARHLATLDCSWLNHECASKQIAGYSFGTYLPPLFTRASADLTAENATLIQRRLAASRLFRPGREPLLLIEIPPLTYFGFGDLPVAEFFRRIVRLAPCGLVLDIGHVWTVYRYSGAWRHRGLREFLDEFLHVFPLHRVVQIHMAGLNVHRAGGKTAEDHGRDVVDSRHPLWIDAHGAPIPEVLWQMLAQVLSHPQLINLKGMALEVDTKSIVEIVTEFERFQLRFGGWFNQKHQDAPEGHPSDCPALTSIEFTFSEGQEVTTQYEHYARVVTNQSDTSSITSPLLGQEHDSLDIYRRQYLPQEILEWGGNVRDMFPETVRELDSHGIPLSTFVEYWFREPRSSHSEYDFFLLKLERVVEFVKEIVPDAVEIAAREADELRAAYHAANEPFERESLHVTA